ncbi:hypothetical protein CHCC14427_3626 [Bacillus paralicheniformis]|nr:hypothetical protein CHCC14427_3626 [Bacillus paralicheniformis]
MEKSFKIEWEFVRNKIETFCSFVRHIICEEADAVFLHYFIVSYYKGGISNESEKEYYKSLLSGGFDFCLYCLFYH